MSSWQGSEGAVPDEELGARDTFERPSQGLGSLVPQAINQFKKVISTELEIVKLKAKAAEKKLAGAAVFLAIAGLAGLGLFWWLFHSVELAFALIFPEWAAALITAGILLIVLALSALIGVLFLKSAKTDVPDVAAGLQEDVDILKEGLGND